MSANDLENDELDNVPLVRMEDVQPSRERISESPDPPKPERHEVFEACADNMEYENECVVDTDNDSNIGSMVSIQSEDVDDDSESGELIVPEVLEPPMEVPIEIPVEIDEGITIKRSPPNRWPTLEILPGGVIKHGDKLEDDEDQKVNQKPKIAKGNGEMMYACAKCSQRFKYLFCLVKHVKWHENQKRVPITLSTDVATLKSIEGDEYICLHSGKKNIVISNAKVNKRKIPKKLKS